jgi:hypothetical protein
MKKTVFSLALLMATAGAAQAQSILQRLSFGVKGGGGVATFTGSGASGLTPIPSFSGGAFAGFKVTEHFSIQEDFLYTQKGSEMDNFLVAGNKLKSTLGYADVHFMLRYAFGEGGNGFFVEAGPTGSFFITQKTEVDNSAGKEVASRGTNKDDFTKIVAGYAGGIGYQLANGLQISARYNGDLMPVYQKDLGYPELNNGVAQVQLGYTFGTRK